MTPNITGGWWHGTRKTSMSFLDGSARVVKGNLLVCDAYSLHLKPLQSPNAGWRRPDMP
jgi:hypothetical protein